MIPIISILFSITLPLYIILKSSRGKALKRAYLLSAASFVSCAGGIIAEIITIKHRLIAGDIGGIEDTISAVIVICILFLAITAIVNVLALGLNYE